MVAMTAYQVNARRSGDWWALEVPELPGVFSQAKRLDKADQAAREAIAVMLDVEPEDVEVSIDAQLPVDAREALEKVEEAKLKAEAAAEAERAAMQRAAKVLTRDLSQRDASRFLGVSFQRVSQLLTAGPVPRTKRKAAVRVSAKKSRGTRSTRKASRGRVTPDPRRSSEHSAA